MRTIDSLYVPDLQPALKHPVILEKFDDLNNGEAFLLINDHDPIPLFYEMKAEKGETFEWKKVEDGPSVWIVEIKKTGGAPATVNPDEQNKEGIEDDVFVLNVTLIEPKLKHSTIFKHFDALNEGEAFQILNDHDPRPLYYQLIGERGNIFTWTYLENGPQRWKVQIKKNDTQSSETVGEIAAKDIHKAEVFKRYGIDFCCGGKKSLKEVCNEKGLDIAVMEAELENPKQTVQSANDFNRWEPGFLADYIYNQHHLFYYNEVLVIKDMLTKVTNHHGGNHPELGYLYSLFTKLVQELDMHFAKEEEVVFPFIKALVLAKKTGNFVALYSQPSLTEPIQLMEADHEIAGEVLAAMKKVTDNYNPPADACNSYRFLYKKLNELDEDLHQHIHLENNILFPKALKLERELQ